MKAIEIIVDAFERINRLSPGETLSDDDAAFAFRRLNILVDELSAQNKFLFLNTLTSAAQSGPITLGVGAWAAVGPGDTIVSMTANNLLMAPVSMRQYNELYVPTTQGIPSVWAQDGMNTVYLYPVPTGQTIKMQTRSSVSQFADQQTDYVAKDGWKAALGAGLAVRIAPTYLGGVPPYLIQAERSTMSNIEFYEPAILNVDTYTMGRNYFPPRLF